MIKLIRKPPMTLLEVLVAMTLLSVLLVFVFGFFADLSRIDEWAHYQQQKTFHKRYGEYRLGYIFSNLVNEGYVVGNNKPLFLLEPSQKTHEFSGFPSLIFRYENHARMDPDFSGDVLGRLYLNKSKQLCLASWPLRTQNQHAAMKKEVLMENIENLKFEFFKTPIQVNSNQPTVGVWQEEWNDKEQLPGLVKIYLTIREKPDPSKRVQNEEELVKESYFVFPLPKQEEEAIFYKKTGSDS